jgi:protein-tyrosine phosphatase/arsenate reductase
MKNIIKKLSAAQLEISEQRKAELAEIAKTIAEGLNDKPISLIFVCTHNSRRSVLAEVWASVFIEHFNLPLKAYSGGTEVTAVHQNTLDCLKSLGFQLKYDSSKINPKVDIKISETKSIITFSKVYHDEFNPQSNFFALMMCQHAAENCPFIPNALGRINLPYKDPKAYDNSPLKEKKYTETALLIGSEFRYMFGLVAEALNH